MQSAEEICQRRTLEREEEGVLERTRILGDAEHGLTVTEIAKLLDLQPSSVRIYLESDKQRIALYRRMFEEDESVKERAIRLLEGRRAS